MSVRVSVVKKSKQKGDSEEPADVTLADSSDVTGADSVSRADDEL